MTRLLPLTLLVFSMSPILCSAEESAPAPEKPTLTGSAELGFLYKTGNTKSADLKTGLDFRYEKDRWLSLLKLDLLVKQNEQVQEDGSEEFSTYDQKWSVTSQTNYSFDAQKNNYVYGNVWYEDDRFNGFDNQSSISVGWGRHWIKTDTTSLFADIGPGYKRDDVKATDAVPAHTNDSVIVQAQALYINNLNEHVEFKQYFSAKMAVSSGENSIYKSETSITTKLIETLQLKLSLVLDYNTEVDDDKENLDTQTAATIVYSF